MRGTGAVIAHYRIIIIALIIFIWVMAEILHWHLDIIDDTGTDSISLKYSLI